MASEIDKHQEPEIDAHKVTVEELCKRFNTTIEGGLSSKQAAEGLERHGLHRIIPKGYVETPKWVRFCRNVVFCFCCPYKGSDDSNMDEYMVEYLKEAQARTATVRRNGEWITVKEEELTLGDVVEVKEGEEVTVTVPADIRIVESTNFKLDRSSLTGEGNWLTYGPGPHTHDNPIESRNLAFWGDKVAEGTAVGIIYCIGMETVRGKISGLGFY